MISSPLLLEQFVILWHQCQVAPRGRGCLFVWVFFPLQSLSLFSSPFSYVMMLTELSFLSNTQANRILHGPKLVRARERKGGKKKTKDKQTLTCFQTHLFFVVLPWCSALGLGGVHHAERFPLPSWTPARPSSDRHVSLLHLRRLPRLQTPL